MPEQPVPRLERVLLRSVRGFRLRGRGSLGWAALSELEQVFPVPVLGRRVWVQLELEFPAWGPLAWAQLESGLPGSGRQAWDPSAAQAQLE